MGIEIQGEDPTQYQHQPDSLREANRKVRLFFSQETANLIDDITAPVDTAASQAIFIDPVLRLQQSADKLPIQPKR